MIKEAIYICEKSMNINAVLVLIKLTSLKDI